MEYLAGGESFDIQQIQNDIYYLLDKGSTVVDVIGSGTYDDGTPYDFSFVDDASRLRLTVGEEGLTAQKMNDTQGATSAYSFGELRDGKYDYELYYYDGSDGSEERFEWKINVPVSNFAPVQLTYTVRLNGPRSDEGVYGTYDANGTQGAAGLYTNNSATLYPVDSNGQQGMPENFRKPTVSYSVGTVTVTPADITVYMGGDEGYEGVINGSDQITGSGSLPEPGFYFTLPDYVNEALRTAGVTPEGEAADLSQYMRIYTQGYTVNGEPTTLNWRLERYGDTYSGAYDRYIYRIVPDPTEGQEAVPVRLQFTSEDGGQTFTSDEFNPSSANALYEQ